MHKENKKSVNSATRRDNKRAKWWELADSIERLFREFCDKASSDGYLDALYVSRNDEDRQIQLFAGQHPIGSSESKLDPVTMRKTYKIHSEHGAALVVSQAVTGDVGIFLYPYSSEKLNRQEENIIWGYYCNPDRLTNSVMKKAMRDFMVYIRVSSACFNETATDRFRIHYLIFKGRKYKDGANIPKIIFSHWIWICLGVIGSIASIYSVLVPSNTQPEKIIIKTETIKYIEKDKVVKPAYKEVQTHKDSLPPISQHVSKDSGVANVHEALASSNVNKTVASPVITISSPRPEIKDFPGGLFFLNPPINSLQVAMLKASERNVPAFVVIYDNEHPTRSKLNYSLGYFMEYQTTKRLVDEFFVSAVVPVSQADARRLIPEDDPLENCRLVIIRADGHILLSEGVYANPDEGLRRVRNVISQWKLNGGKSNKSGS